MLKRSALAALVLAGLGSGAVAQENFGAKPSGSMGAIYNSSTQMTLLRQEMNNEAQSGVTLEQRRRAQKAVALIKANHCEDAYKLALSEEDYRLALNIAATCKARVRE